MAPLTTMPPVPGAAVPAVTYHQGETALADFVALLKPRVMSLVVFTGVVGMLLAPGALHPALAVTAVLCIAVGAGAAGAINMWYERDIDALMMRTQDRPLPAGRMEPGTALAFGVVLAVGAVTLMGLAVNHLAAGLLAASIAFYVFVYTLWLKRRTPQNIVIGGAAGAFPPVIGWAAVTGSIAVEPLTLFALIFFWTPPHFWALALYRHADYARAGVPMLPVTAGDAATRRQMLWYTVALLPISLAPWWVGLAGLGYAVVAAFLGLAFVVVAVAVRRDVGDRWARRMFVFSLFYLALLFAALLAERIVLPVA